VKKSYGEGLATHTGPESCGAACEGGVEALTGVRAGRVFSRERQFLRGADAVRRSGRLHRRVGIARRNGTLRGQRPRARTETPRTRTGRSPGRPWRRSPRAASGSRSTHADDERPGEVGQAGSTDEVAEQRRATGRGGDGGKRSGQRKPATANASRTPSRTDVRSALERVRQAASRDKKVRFTALLHHVYDIDRLRMAYLALKREAAPGVDGEKWRHYGESLEEHLYDLSERLKRGGTERSRFVGCTSRRRTGGNDRSGCPRWRTKSFSAPPSRCSSDERATYREVHIHHGAKCRSGDGAGKGGRTYPRRSAPCRLCD
jgi:RNA-directed DNA polymerase